MFQVGLKQEDFILYSILWCHRLEIHEISTKTTFRGKQVKVATSKPNNLIWDIGIYSDETYDSGGESYSGTISKP